VHVGLDGSEPIGTVVPVPSHTPSETASILGIKAISMGPTASGEVSGCKKYYTV